LRAGDLPLRGTDRSFAEVPGLSLVGEPWIPVLAGSTAATACRCGVHLWPGSGLAYSSFRSVKVSDFAAALYKHGEHRQLYAVSSFGSRALPTSELRPTILHRTARSNVGANRSKGSHPVGNAAVAKRCSPGVSRRSSRQGSEAGGGEAATADSLPGDCVKSQGASLRVVLRDR